MPGSRAIVKGRETDEELKPVDGDNEAEEEVKS
jgi:hypothetical protein